MPSESESESLNVTVFGATGKIGWLVVASLLEAGHHVTAYVRNPAKLGITDPNLTVREGVLVDRPAIRDSVRGSDAVISALGPSLKLGAKGTPIADGTANIVAAMQAEGVKRFIGLATPSVPDPRDRPTLKAKVLPVMAGIMFPNALKELRGMTRAVVASGLDWTVARITNPTDKPAAGTLRVGYLGRDKVGSAMSRADIAAFLIAQLTDETYVKALPAISN
jgi:nucleoside-diphosphate-sugar epimerase